MKTSGAVNSQRRAVMGWFIVSLVGWLIFAAPLVLNIDPFEGGGALLMLGLVMALTGFAVGLLFRGRAAAFDRLVKGGGTLARWEYDAATWQAFSQVDLEETAGELRASRLIVFWISLAVCGGLYLTVDEARWVFPAAFAFINVLVWLVSAVRLRVTRARGDRGPVAVLISRTGALVGGELHVWKGALLRLDEVELLGRNPLVLAITYSTWVRHSWAPYTLRIPVPPEAGEQARTVAEMIAQEQGR